MEPNRFGDIAAFVSAAKAGSFTAAAASLGLTRSAVGKSIARLEPAWRCVCSIAPRAS